MYQAKRNLFRACGFIFGFMLLFEPFTLLARLIGVFVEEPGFSSIHLPCVRIPLFHLLSGDLDVAGPTSLTFTVMLIFASMLIGPVFCGFFCPAGGVTEILSRLVPERFKIDWSVYVPITPLRCGFFAGFLAAGLSGLATPCGFCNFYVLDVMITFAISGELITNQLSLLATFFVWFLILGLFSKGGRGFCNFLCPVGALQGLCHYLGRKLPFAFGIQTDTGKCIGCGKCSRVCPMRAITLATPAEGKSFTASDANKAGAPAKSSRPKAKVDALRCICCGECASGCPVKAIRYGRKKAQHG